MHVGASQHDKQIKVLFFKLMPDGTTKHRIFVKYEMNNQIGPSGKL